MTRTKASRERFAALVGRKVWLSRELETTAGVRFPVGSEWVVESTSRGLFVLKSEKDGRISNVEIGDFVTAFGSAASAELESLRATVAKLREVLELRRLAMLDLYGESNSTVSFVRFEQALARLHVEVDPKGAEELRIAFAKKHNRRR